MPASIVVGIAGFGLGLAACWPAAANAHTVGTAEEAISIGVKACDASVGANFRRQGMKWQAHPELWHARLAGDHWEVWDVNDGHAPSTTIEVAREGDPPKTTACTIKAFND